MSEYTKDEIMVEKAPYVNKWHRELDVFIELKSLILLEGNILDIYTYPDNGIDMTLPDYLSYYLKSKGYS